MKNYLLIALFITLVGCGANANLSFTTNSGNCAQFNAESTNILESAPAPYCMQVIMTNNGGGNNFVNSTSASINSINMNLVGANNIIYPATSSNMDPNNCLNSSLNPGSSCTFYMQINKESYSVSQNESASLTLTYTVQNTLFGNGSGSGSSTLNFYEVTNLYIPQSNGNVTLLNASSTPFSTITGLFKTSSLNLQTIAIDTSVFGYLYLGGSSGIYLYGDKAASPSIGINSVTSANNLINTGNGSVYATPDTGVYAWNISNAAWTNNGTQATFGLSVTPNSNVHTYSSSGSIYLASNNLVYVCNSSSTTSANACTYETSNKVPGTTTNPTVNTLSYTSAYASNLTGLYVGSNYGLYAESIVAGSSTSAATNNIWTQVYSIESQPISTSITASTIDASGNLYAGDSNGTIWMINSTSGANNQAYNLTNISSSGGIKHLRVDNKANPYTLYIITNGNNLYSCALQGVTSNSVPSCSPAIVSNSTNMYDPIGMRIGSELRTSL